MLTSTMSTLFLALLLTLSFSIHAQQQIPNPTLGPPQVCRCYPVGAPGICPTTAPSTHITLQSDTISPLTDTISEPLGLPFLPPRLDPNLLARILLWLESLQCSKRVRMDISFVADDGVSLYVCGTKVRQSSHFDEMQTFTYDANCGDFMLEVDNKGLSAGVALLITIGGRKYGTTDSSSRFRVDGTTPLFAIAKTSPTGQWFMNPPDYDFSTWTQAVVVESILGIGPNFNSLASQGAFPINVQSGNVSPGTYGLKLYLPFWCIL